ncbi:20 kDa chaperonin, chloroplastic-like isoform X1 [Quercus suber]|uniref:20 kDa chaperonin, chloroplastic-like isoform X1 n=1 Tax=Quercus suber TaxID=58331 RepID=UPI0032DF3D1E
MQLGIDYTDIKTLGDRVLVKIKTAEEKTDGGILVPKTAQTKPRGGEVVATREGKIVGKSKVDISVKIGTQIVYSKHTGTELEFNGSKHLILKDDDIVGILESDDAKEPKPLNDRVLIKCRLLRLKRLHKGDQGETFHWDGDCGWA